MAQCTRPIAALLFLLLPLPSLAQEPPKSKPVDVDFRPRRLLNPQPAITEFETKSANEASRTLDPSELVLGVVVGDEARAYPINMLTGPHREIINDVVNDRPIAATW